MRKIKLVEIEANNRDQGKAFKITEMSAFAAERWAIRAGFAMMNSGADFSELDGQPMSMAAFAKMGLSALSKISFDLAEPLIDELMTCVEIIPDPNQVKITRPLIEQDVEEVTTLLTLKKEVWALHVDFFMPADPSTSALPESKTAG